MPTVDPMEVLRKEIEESWVPIHDADRFLVKVYRYYQQSGFRPFVLQKISNLLIQVFIFFLFCFLFLGIDYQSMSKAVAEASTPVDISIFFKPNITIGGVSFLLWFGGYIIIYSILFVKEMIGVMEVRRFYHQILHLQDHDLRGIEFGEVMNKIKYNSNHLLGGPHQLNPLQIISRIMRKENYFIGLYEQRSIVPSMWFPFVGSQPYLCKSLLYINDIILSQYIFGGRRSMEVREDVLDRTKRDTYVNGLKLRFRLVGLISILVSVFIIPFVFAYYFFRYGDEFRRNPSFAFTERRWTRYAKYNLREFNELQGDFYTRLNQAYKPGMQYINQFQSEYIPIVARFVTYVVGSLLVIMVIVGFVDNSVIYNGELFGWSLFWYLGVGGTLVAFSRTLIPDAHFTFEPEKDLRQVKSIIHHYPPHWIIRARSWEVFNEIQGIFVTKMWYMFTDTIGVLLTPFILLFAMPKRCEAIIDFISQCTTTVPNIGRVCSLASFDDRDFVALGSPSWGKRSVLYSTPMAGGNANSIWRQYEGKMERSLLSFAMRYPQWRCNAEAKRILQEIAQFSQLSHISGEAHELLLFLLQKDDHSILDRTSDYISKHTRTYHHELLDILEEMAKDHESNSAIDIHGEGNP